ncbi:MAG: response regulator [Ktedonobacteraceae bacterium]|nr:response regulator [Ktedonobacteraceae bacterium]
MESEQNQRTRSPIVLIIDDNQEIRNVIAWSLHHRGFQPVEAANGLEALRWMEDAASKQRYPSVILLDLAMPGIDGYSFLDWMQSTWGNRSPTPAIIVMTAGQLDTTSPPLSPLVNQIIAKPFHLHDLEDVIRTWCA